jgi:hypothetical protein
MAPGECVKGYYAYTSKLGASGSGTVTFEGTPIPRGCLGVLSFISVIDYTTADKKLILGVRDAGGNDRYLRVVDIANTYEAVLEGPIVLLEGETPIGIVESPTTSDVLYFSAYGVLRAP